MRHIETPPVHRLVYQVSEVAEILTVSRDLVYKLVRTKQIPSFHLGGRIVIPRDKFDAWFESQGR